MLYRHFRIAAFITVALLLLAVLLLAVYGKNGSFLVINSWNTAGLDRIMPYVTYLGDGLIYIPILLLTFFFRRDYIVAILAGIIICFLLSTGLKWYAFPNEMRPISLVAQHINFHRVAGVEMNEKYSFPSGHTATAFTMGLLLAALQRQRLWVIALPFVALMVGFSRIYLGQHFLTDVAGGMFIGLISAAISLFAYKRFHEAVQKD